MVSLQDEKEKETKPSKTSQAADSAKKAGPETCGIGCVIASQLFVYGSSTLQLDGHPRSSRASVATLEGPRLSSQSDTRLDFYFKDDRCCWAG